MYHVQRKNVSVRVKKVQVKRCTLQYHTDLTCLNEGGTIASLVFLYKTNVTWSIKSFLHVCYTWSSTNIESYLPTERQYAFHGPVSRIEVPKSF